MPCDLSAFFLLNLPFEISIFVKPLQSGALFGGKFEGVCHPIQEIPFAIHALPHHSGMRTVVAFLRGFLGISVGTRAGQSNAAR